MVEKRFSHNNIVKCKISNKNIDTTKERYCIILDCDEEKINTIGFYKQELLRDLIVGKLQLVKEELTKKHIDLAKTALLKLNKIKNG